MAPLISIVAFVLDPVRAGDTTQVRAFIQEGGVDLMRWAVLEARAVENLPFLRFLARTQSPCRAGPRPGLAYSTPMTWLLSVSWSGT